ncbi:Protein disulfide-isomerase [Hortaea werneckii]|uniref:protein disulfide-isomerase n=1 Tax=Hortaea werneckii TaxID=91943 RepID=A0A3M7CDE2_HORWE|nr:Protein disulfide-isomerase [Hortaea werneckii]KAI7095601.1 Protein disulfide-isomerase [Hortaea werneckii]KAI7212203.1 Protein disulfide-isomerase [Hortaea werneckii]KAI7316460.1 Protein disulfide-isomerase [Hortaea werneckii]KAI7393550.1 Protein disulfide-isomerase [Hortaea werneckii]
MTRLSQLLTASLAIFGSSVAAAVVDLTPSNFDEIVHKSGKPALVEFFAPWCGHCKNLAPVYEELGQQYEFAKDKVTIAKVDADEHKSLGRDYGVQGFPTLKWFDGKSKEPQDYRSGRDIDSLAGFITDKTGIKPKVKKGIPSPVEMLNDKSFKEQIGGEKDALVAFTAPWCGHCKSLAPTWEKLAADFAAETGVLIAKVDCEAENAKAVAKAAGIKSYPTINYYPAGSVDAVPYTGGRTEDALVQFVNSKAGTHRTAGGGLDKLAGTIPSLDALLANLKTGEASASAYAELETAAKAVQDKSAEYYGKVAAKLQENGEYAAKELARLQGLMGQAMNKGGLKQEKMDDLIVRSNILSRFLGGGKEEGKDEL